MASKYLLTIDGGGLRGIIPASLLAALEDATGKLTRETFSFVAGTSTGSILAAGIAAGVPAKELLRLYCEDAPQIFGRHPEIVSRVIRFLGTPPYSTRDLRDLIARYITDSTGEDGNTWTLNKSPVDLLITAKRLSDGMPWYFVRDRRDGSPGTGELPLVDCVAGSLAAPTYFAPWKIPLPDKLLQRGRDRAQSLEFVDGGIGVAGNPVYQACVEAFIYNRDEYRAADTVIVSLGTGRFIPQNYAGPPDKIWEWIGWILGEMFESAGEQQTEIVHQHYPEARLYRLDARLERDIALDDQEAIDELRAYAERFAEVVNWTAILAGTDAEFLVDDKKTLPQDYLWPRRP